jgi:diguanylate cyclase (GGDEF)-like protein
MGFSSDTLVFAFQPIVNARSGSLYAVEGLVRGTEGLGYGAIPDMFDHAHQERRLRALETSLTHQAMEAFAGLPFREGLRLFLNLDTRVLDEPPHHVRWLTNSLLAHGLSPDLFTVELTERYVPTTEMALEQAVGELRAQNIRVALDDFGQGVSGLKICFDLHPDMIKIDRYFLQGANTDPRRRVVMASIIAMAHGLGIIVIAEGVETSEELRVCQELGVDLVQGFFVARPSTNPADIQATYDHVAAIGQISRRNAGEAATVSMQIERLPTINVRAHLLDVLEKFRQHRNSTFMPVIDDSGQPIGIVRESDIKVFSYGRYGRELLKNPGSRHQLRALVARCPIMDINARIEEMVHAYTADFGEEGVLIINDGRYHGFLNSRALLGIVSDRNIANARDQNPLTRLPGNKIVSDTIASALAETDRLVVLVYFDFDHFKPFNDTYGFRQGDRALVLFAQLMSKSLPPQDVVIGHIGGDDFFAAFDGRELDDVVALIQGLLLTFENDITSFYDADARACGYIEALDRAGQPARFPLMRVSCAIAVLRPGRGIISAEKLTETLARVKHDAKCSDDHMAVVTFGPPPIPLLKRQAAST